MRFSSDRAVAAERTAFGFPTPDRRMRWLAGIALSLSVTAAHAVVTYDTGTLSFSTTDQSMWSTGPATKFEDAVFVGAQWSNSTVGLGGIVGSVTETTIITNPAWWIWKGCKETVNFLCGSEPSKNEADIIVDTRTGARLDLTSSGKFGLEFGYTLDAGSVNAAADFTATALLPTNNPGTGNYFSLQPVSSLDAGSLSSQSPKAEAYINAIAQLSGSVTAQACLILAGCTPEGTASLPTLNANQPILSIDPNSLKVIPGLLPAPDPNDPNLPLAEVKLLNQELTLEGALSATGVPGFQLGSNFGVIATTIPPGPSANVDLASIEFNVPDIATSGVLENGQIKSGGRDDFLHAKLDIDGVATMAGFPPLGIGVDLINSGGFKVGAQFDALDIDAGPDIGITQDFELEPTLMARLDFSHPVFIDGLVGPQTFWEGIWEDLPDLALQKTTTINPTFWIEALLTNTIGIDLGLSGTMDILKLTFGASYNGVKIIGTNPISLNSLLGLGNELFSTDKLEFPIFSTPFLLGGFNTIQAAAFTITVPAPGTLAVIVIGLAAAGGVRCRRRLWPPAAGVSADR